MRDLNFETQLIDFLSNVSYEELVALRDIDLMSLLHTKINCLFTDTETSLFYIKIMSLYAAICTTIQVNTHIPIIDIDYLFNDVFDIRTNNYSSQSIESKQLVSQYFDNNHSSFADYFRYSLQFRYIRPIKYNTIVNEYNSAIINIQTLCKSTYTSLKSIYFQLFTQTNPLQILPTLTSLQLDILLEECRSVLSSFYIQYDIFIHEYNKLYEVLRRDILFEVTKLRIKHLKNQYII